MTKAAELWNKTLGLARRLPRKVVYVAVAAVLTYARTRVEGLPSAEFITDAMLALLACHTVTDVAVTVATITAEAKGEPAP